MALVTEKPTAVFDLVQIKCGYLFWGRHCTWEEGKAGLVTAATEKQLVVQYFPGIGNVTNHFIVPVSEVVEGQWEIRWSADLSEVFEHNIKTDGEQQETEKTEGTEGLEGGTENDDIGRADS